MLSFNNLRPDNIRLDATGHAHITGFDNAVQYSDHRMPANVVGSIAYMGERHVLEA